MEATYLILFLMLGLLIGILMTWLISKFYYSAKSITPGELKSNYVSKELFKSEQEENARLNLIIEKKDLQLQQVLTDLGGAEQQVALLTQRFETHKEEIAANEEQLELRFEKLANKLLDEKADKFSLHSQAQLNHLLLPFKNQLEVFQKQVTEVYKSEARERFTLQGEIKSLLDLNQKISQEAKNLTDALKGDNKTQGNWGELILEKILERSGLTRGNEYEVQVSSLNGEGNRIQPDVVINLPEGKHLIIDSKVSLNAYEQFVNASEASDQAEALKRHLLSIRSHIKGLSEKNYASARKLNTPDFVLIFMPIESAFSAAIQSDSDLFNYAWDRKIVLVSPTTLLATLRTISSIWKQEKQTRYAVDIANQAGSLYDKFVGFVDDMKKIESSIQQTDKAFHAAMNKLQFGKGNLIRRAEKIKALGIKTSKKLPDSILEDESDDSLISQMTFK